MNRSAVLAQSGHFMTRVGPGYALKVVPAYALISTGGRGWLTGRAIVARANFAAALAAGRLNSDITPTDLAGLAKRRAHSKGPHEVLGFFVELLTGRRPDQAVVHAAWQAADTAGGSKPEGINRAVALLLAGPDAQLC